MRYTADGFCFATVRPGFRVRIPDAWEALRDRPLHISVVEDGYTRVPLARLRKHYLDSNPYRELDELGRMHLALIDSLEHWLRGGTALTEDGYILSNGAQEGNTPGWDL